MKTVLSILILVQLFLSVGVMCHATPQKADEDAKKTTDPVRELSKYPVLLPGRTVRVTATRDEANSRFTRSGKILDLRESGLLLELSSVRRSSIADRHSSDSQASPQTIDIPFARIEQIQLREDKGSHFARGFLIGGLAGGVLGALARDTDSNHPSAPGINGAVLVLGVVAGLVVGGAIGAGIPKYEWSTVPRDWYDSGE